MKSFITLSFLVVCIISLGHGEVEKENCGCGSPCQPIDCKYIFNITLSYILFQNNSMKFQISMILTF